MYAFDYHRPASLADAAKLLGEKQNATILAGGMTLIPTLKQRLAQPSDLIDLRDCPGLVGVAETGGALVIGAMTTHATVAETSLVAERLPVLARLAAGIGDAQVRNRGTIGGSVANNDPAADYPAACLALGASVVTDRREIAADAYFSGSFDTALEDREIITALRFPIPRAAAYEKFARPASRYALVGVCVARADAVVRVAVTGAREKGVFRLSAFETALTTRFSAEAVEGVAVPEHGLLSDLHGSAAYRARLIGVLAKRAVTAAR